MVPAHQVSAGAGIDKRKLGLNVSATFVDAVQGTAKPGDKTDAYFLLEASLKSRIFDHDLELDVNGRNLTNDSYIASRRPSGARPGAPLWILAGIRGEL